MYMQELFHTQSFGRDAQRRDSLDTFTKMTDGLNTHMFYS